MKTLEASTKDFIAKHQAIIDQILLDLKEAILACPGPSEASGIKTIPGKPNCCTVSSSSLVGGSWGAETYIFSSQYKALANLIVAGDANKAIDRLTNALDKGKVKSRPWENINLHPEVIANVRKMLKENA